LSALSIERRSTAEDGLEQEHWSVHLRLVRQQRSVLDPDDRAGLVAQQQAWLDEACALDGVSPAARVA
jgi:hypothetical protein